MATPRLRVAPPPRSAQVPDDDPVAPVRDRLAAERQRLDAMCPGALDLAAEVLTRLHEDLRGEVADLAGDRTPRYRRGQLLAEHGLLLEDLLYLYLRRPAAVIRALAPIAREVEHSPRSIGDAGAELAEAGGLFLRDLLLSLADGSLTYGEADQLARDLDNLEQGIREARAALVRRRA